MLSARGHQRRVHGLQSWNGEGFNCLIKSRPINLTQTAVKQLLIILTKQPIIERMTISIRRWPFLSFKATCEFGWDGRFGSLFDSKLRVLPHHESFSSLFYTIIYLSLKSLLWAILISVIIHASSRTYLSKAGYPNTIDILPAPLSSIP